eukprot:gnl/MRDRNA2_/MRDRNA2_63965_c0_seq1.p1 gnl/MRDRNA2_/MRDRNA2_63965_c0~~gnl/MRDRNA2_/MRDRNA2_63965_c0_seq1.p1  ORF type:complete len:829 (+),score=191.81 gnl/MRDRNA2_/MRDRNA2_63965_c0_seq1:3-2489(+)
MYGMLKGPLDQLSEHCREHDRNIIVQDGEGVRTGMFEDKVGENQHQPSCGDSVGEKIDFVDDLCFSESASCNTSITNNTSRDPASSAMNSFTFYSLACSSARQGLVSEVPLVSISSCLNNVEVSGSDVYGDDGNVQDCDDNSAGGHVNFHCGSKVSVRCNSIEQKIVNIQHEGTFMSNTEAQCAEAAFRMPPGLSPPGLDQPAAAAGTDGANFEGVYKTSVVGALAHSTREAYVEATHGSGTRGTEHRGAGAESAVAHVQPESFRMENVIHENKKTNATEATVDLESSAILTSKAVEATAEITEEGASVENVGPGLRAIPGEITQDAAVAEVNGNDPTDSEDPGDDFSRARDVARTSVLSVFIKVTTATFGEEFLSTSVLNSACNNGCDPREAAGRSLMDSQSQHVSLITESKQEFVLTSMVNSAGSHERNLQHDAEKRLLGRELQQKQSAAESQREALVTDLQREALVAAASRDSRSSTCPTKKHDEADEPRLASGAAQARRVSFSELQPEELRYYPDSSFEEGSNENDICSNVFVSGCAADDEEGTWRPHAAAPAEVQSEWDEWDSWNENALQEEAVLASSIMCETPCPTVPASINASYSTAVPENDGMTARDPVTMAEAAPITQEPRFQDISTSSRTGCENSVSNVEADLPARASLLPDILRSDNINREDLVAFREADSPLASSSLHKEMAYLDSLVADRGDDYATVTPAGGHSGDMNQARLTTVELDMKDHQEQQIQGMHQKLTQETQMQMQHMQATQQMPQMQQVQQVQQTQQEGESSMKQQEERYSHQLGYRQMCQHQQMQQQLQVNQQQQQHQQRQQKQQN